MPKTDIIDLIMNQEELLPQRNRYYGLYYGLVEDNKDPLRLNRLRIRTCITPDVESMPTAALSWANYSSPFGGDQDIGLYAVPTIGSQVVVSFIDGDPLRMVYMGTVWGNPDGAEGKKESSETFVVSIEDSQAENWDFTKYINFRTPYGHMLEFDDNVTTGAGEDESSARVKLVTPLDYYIHLSEVKDKKHLELHTEGLRNFRLDDTNETCRLDTPDGHFMEVSSVGDFIHFETEDGHSIHMDDPNEFIRFQTSKDLQVLLDQKNKHYLMKGVDNDYFYEMREGSHMCMVNGYPNRTKSFIGFQRVANSIDESYMVSGPSQKNGFFSTPRNGFSPGKALMFAGTSGSPTHVIELVTEDGGGKRTGYVEIGEPNIHYFRMDPLSRQIRIKTNLQFHDGDIFIKGRGAGILALVISGPLTSTYFKHTHFLDMTSPGNPNSLVVIVTGGSSTGTYAVSNGTASPAQTTKVQKDA